jgi:hypothetical protein
MSDVAGAAQIAEPRIVAGAINDRRALRSAPFWRAAAPIRQA